MGTVVPPLSRAHHRKLKRRTCATASGVADVSWIGKLELKGPGLNTAPELAGSDALLALGAESLPGNLRIGPHTAGLRLRAPRLYSRM